MAQSLGHRVGRMEGGASIEEEAQRWQLIGIQLLEYEQVQYNYEGLAQTTRSQAKEMKLEKRKKDERILIYLSISINGNEHILLIFSN